MDGSFYESLPEAYADEQNELQLVDVLRRFFERVQYATGTFSIQQAAEKALEDLNGPR